MIINYHLIWQLKFLIYWNFKRSFKYNYICTVAMFSQNLRLKIIEHVINTK